MLGPEPAKPPSRLAQIGGRMQRAAAKRTSLLARRLGKIGIAGEQQMMEGSVGQQVSIQRMPPPLP